MSCPQRLTSPADGTLVSPATITIFTAVVAAARPPDARPCIAALQRCTVLPSCQPVHLLPHQYPRRFPHLYPRRFPRQYYTALYNRPPCVPSRPVHVVPPCPSFIPMLCVRVVDTVLFSCFQSRIHTHTRIYADACVACVALFPHIRSSFSFFFHCWHCARKEIYIDLSHRSGWNIEFSFNNGRPL